MRRMTKPRRGGFTLVELLVVVSILALLAALAAFAFLRARGGAEVSATEATLQKLRGGMDKRWRAVLDGAAEDATNNRIPAELLRFAGNDKDRARAMWTYVRLKNEFPTTIAEACNPVVIRDAANNLVLSLPPKSVFTAGFKLPPGATNVTCPTDPALQSAACFQWALSATAVRGETFEGDGTAQQVGEAGPLVIKVGGVDQPSLAVRVFKDAWGVPIVFLRQAYITSTNELDSPQFTKAPQFRDPVDPQGRLVNFTNPVWQPAQFTAFWNSLNGLPARHLDYDGVTFPASGNPTYQTTGTGSNLSPRNWMPTLISAGANKKFWFEEGTNFGADDDLFSFRLARDSKGN